MYKSLVSLPGLKPHEAWLTDHTEPFALPYFTPPVAREVATAYKMKYDEDTDTFTIEYGDGEPPEVFTGTEVSGEYWLYPIGHGWPWKEIPRDNHTVTESGR